MFSGRIHARTVLAAFLLLPTTAALATRSSESRSPLEWGFEFASAIESDAKDRAMAQERVALDYSILGRTDEAENMAARIEGWRQGVAYAEIAAELARRGNAREAESLLSKAQQVRAQTEGWQGPRIESHVAWAQAILGKTDLATPKAAELVASDIQYVGKSAAIEAVSRAHQGDVAGAIDDLRKIDTKLDPESAWWQFFGHIEIARTSSLPVPEARRVLASARGIADAMITTQRAEALTELAKAYRERGWKREAKKCLEEADRVVVLVPPTAPLKVPLASELARGWAAVGKRSRARRILDGVDANLERTPLIERPAALANLAAGWAAAGVPEKAAAVLDEALDQAEALVNARPRALAVVEICRAMGRFGMTLTPGTETRLQALRLRLGDPW